MFILVIALVVFLSVATLPLALKTGFTSEELIDMGVCLENIQSIEPLTETPTERVNTPRARHSCLFNSLSA